MGMRMRIEYELDFSEDEYYDLQQELLKEDVREQKVGRSSECRLIVNDAK